MEDRRNSLQRLEHLRAEVEKLRKILRALTELHSGISARIARLKELERSDRFEKPEP